MPLVGAEGYAAMINLAPELGRETGLAPWRIEHLLGRYGSLLGEVLSLADDDPSLLQPVPRRQEYLRAECGHAATHEAALHLDDLLARRTRMSIETRHRGTQSAEAVARLVAPIFGWTDDETARAVASYLARVEAELESQKELADSEANAERLSAPDARRIPVSRTPDRH